IPCHISAIGYSGWRSSNSRACSTASASVSREATNKRQAAGRMSRRRISKVSMQDLPRLGIDAGVGAPHFEPLLSVGQRLATPDGGIVASLKRGIDTNGPPLPDNADFILFHSPLACLQRQRHF